MSCSAEPAEVVGTYEMTLINQSDGCRLDMQPGDAIDDVSMTFSQDGSKITGSVDGVAGTLLQLWLGEQTFAGTVDSSAFQFRIAGSRAQQQGNCAYTIDIDAVGRVAGDQVRDGILRWRPRTNDNSDCGFLASCVTVQSFSGRRLPLADAGAALR